MTGAFLNRQLNKKYVDELKYEILYTFSSSKAVVNNDYFYFLYKAIRGFAMI